jgi:hypothetical protein
MLGDFLSMYPQFGKSLIIFSKECKATLGEILLTKYYNPINTQYEKVSVI